MRTSPTLVLLCAAVLHAGGLDSAWIEYRFQNWPRAEALFREVLGEHAGSADSAVQARFGLALVDHYRMPGARPDRALEEYREQLAIVGEAHALAPRLHLCAARACADLDPPDTATARMEFAAAIAGEDLVVAGEAVLDQACLMVRTPTAETVAAARAYLARMDDSLGATPLDAALHQLAGGLAMEAGAYRESVTHLAAALDAGGQTDDTRATMLLQAARMSEKRLADTTGALVYYRRFVSEIPADTRRYFVEQRIGQLEGGPDEAAR